MTDNEMLTVLEGLCGEVDSDTLSAYLLMAKSKVIAHLYPYGSTNVTIPHIYDMVVIEIACYLVSKRGAEGQYRHSENGVDRTYGSSDIPEEYLRKIVPFAGKL